MSRFDYILHRADGVTTVELNSQVGTFRAVTSAILQAKRQDVSSAELTLVSSEAFTVNVGDWIEAKGMRLYCMSTIDRYTCSEDNNREYQLTFYDPIYYLRQAIFYNTSESVSEGVYSYSRVDNAYPSVGTFEDFAKLCCYNCNSVQGVRMFKVGTVSESIATDIRVLNFSDYNCLAVLKQTCEDFETTWRVRINKDPDPDSLFIIDFGVEIEDFPVTLQVEKSQGLMSIEVTASDKDVFTQFVVKGGTDNLPSDYPHTNLQLDEDLEGTPPVYANSIIKLPDIYARWGKSVKELIFEDINPSRTGDVSAISEDILKFRDNGLIGVEWSPVGGTIHFVSGHLIGFTFNCKAFDPETGLITIESAQENNGFILPSETDSYYRIGIGDKYNVAGVSLPASYVSAAKTELKERALLVINGYWSQQRIESIIKIDPSIISVDIVPNMGFHIIHNALGIDKIIMAKQVIYDLSLNYPYDIESITVSDWATDDSRADTLHRRVALAQILAKKKQQKGDPGEDGVTTYTWIKYASDSSGTGITDDPAGMTYIGFAYNKTTPSESNTPSDYSWSLIKGTDGQPGADGADGQTLYTWIKYADTPTSGMSDSPTGKTYIGIAVNKTTSVESSTYADYTWSLIKGADGIDGVDAVYYYLTPSVDAVIRSMDGTATPSTVSCAQYKIQGGGTPVAANKTIKYQRSIDGTMQTYSTAVAVSTSIYIDFYLYDGVTELWRTRVPVLHDLDEWESTLNDFAKGLGYTDTVGGDSAYEKLVGAALAGETIMEGGYLRNSLIDTEHLIAHEAFIKRIATNDAFIEDLTVRFLQTVYDAYDCRVNIRNTTDTEESGASYVKLEHSGGGAAGLEYDTRVDEPVTKVTKAGKNTVVYSDGLLSQLLASSSYGYDQWVGISALGMVVAQGVYPTSTTTRIAIAYNVSTGLVQLYFDDLPRGAFGTAPGRHMYRSPDGLSNDIIRYQSP